MKQLVASGDFYPALPGFVQDEADTCLWRQIAWAQSNG